MYKCENCGHLFDEGEQINWTEPHGEKMSGCPLCKGSYEEAMRCVSCGSWYSEEKLMFDVCDDCIDTRTKDFDFCVKIGATESENVPINGAIASLFDADEINDILAAVAKNIKDVSFKSFVEEDRSWFAQMIADEVKK
jgi:predicted  nucleic acid-binding Zn-ribbon protein